MRHGSSLAGRQQKLAGTASTPRHGRLGHDQQGHGRSVLRPHGADLRNAGHAERCHRAGNPGHHHRRAGHGHAPAQQPAHQRHAAAGRAAVLHRHEALRRAGQHRGALRHRHRHRHHRRHGHRHLREHPAASGRGRPGRIPPGGRPPRRQRSRQRGPDRRGDDRRQLPAGLHHDRRGRQALQAAGLHQDLCPDRLHRHRADRSSRRRRHLLFCGNPEGRGPPEWNACRLAGCEPPGGLAGWRPCCSAVLLLVGSALVDASAWQCRRRRPADTTGSRWPERGCSNFVFVAAGRRPAGVLQALPALLCADAALVPRPQGRVSVASRCLLMVLGATVWLGFRHARSAGLPDASAQPPAQSMRTFPGLGQGVHAAARRRFLPLHADHDDARLHRRGAGHPREAGHGHRVHSRDRVGRRQARAGRDPARSGADLHDRNGRSTTSRSTSIDEDGRRAELPLRPAKTASSSATRAAS